MLFSSSFYTTVVSDGLHEPYLLLTNSSFILILSDSHRGSLIWVKFVEIPKQKFESQLNVIYLAPVVQRLDNAIHRINHYPVDSVVCFVNTYPLDSDLSGG